MASKNLNATQFASWNISFGEWVETSSEGGVWVWSRVSPNPLSGYRVGRVALPGANIGSGILKSAKLYIKTADFYTGYNPLSFRFAASNALEAYKTDITASYMTTASASYAQNTVYSFDITSIIGNVGNINSPFYIFLIVNTPDNSDIVFQRLSSYQAYLQLEYEETGDTVGRYNGSVFQNCEVFCHNGTQFIQCDVYRYDGSQFIRCSTT